ncbi:MAG: UTP--glucose-1-phosphate uridylyltransferase [Clostridia bacterium]|nr:UTP--glucose-1-phosphate uridylyltransferase [Clostridia bacterium]
MEKAKKVRKAIIPAAGLGTRMLPISRAVPKEMLPIMDYPAIYYLVKEAAESGITDILIITGRDKECMEEFFDYSPEYDATLAAKGKLSEIEGLHGVCDLANVYFLRQKQPKGLGHAVLRAKDFVGDEPFAILYGDDIVFSKTPVVKQLIDAYETYGRAAVGVKEVSKSDLSKYCSMKAEAIEGSDVDFFVDDMIEKPKPGEEFSNLAILGRVLLTPEIFEILERTPLGAGGELQLTDAMAEYARKKGVTARIFDGDRYDIGSKLGFIKANFVKALEHPETKEEFEKFVKEYIENGKSI